VSSRITSWLVTLVPGLTYPPEREAIGVEPKQRGAVIDDALPLLRRLWAGETVTSTGKVVSLTAGRLQWKPVRPRIPTGSAAGPPYPVGDASRL